jgi:Domain of unknown function (DUF4209)
VFKNLSIITEHSFPISAEIIAVLNADSTTDSYALAAAFKVQAHSSSNEGWELLGNIFCFGFDPSNLRTPFGPMFVHAGNQSLIPDDLSEQQLNALEATLKEIDDPLYRARIGDVLWIRKKNVEAARIAVAAYFEAGKKVENPNKTNDSMQLYERAIRLARQIEPKGELPKSVLSHLESRVKHYNGTDLSYFNYGALKILAEFKFGNFAELAEIAGRMADCARTECDFHCARNYFDLQAKHLMLAKNSSSAEIARINSARTFAEEAESKEVDNEFIAALQHWMDAINAFKNRPLLRPEIPELRQRYTFAGERLESEMSTISSDKIDLSELIEESRAAVSNLAWADAFFTFVSKVQLIDPVALRERANELIHKNPLQAMTGTSFHDASGRKISHRPSAFTEDKDQIEKAICGFMEQIADQYRQIKVAACIAPMMRQLISDHKIDNSSFASILEDSAVIPDDRREWFYEAFAAGFRRDFSGALHVLIPQFENALRHVLQKNDITPKNIDADGVENFWGFERILNEPRAKDIFGTELVYELNSLLVEPLGQNFRNCMSHGLLSPNDFKGASANYLWWLILRIVAFPTAAMCAFLEKTTSSDLPD